MDHERDGGRHGDVEVDDLRLRHLGALKMIDLLAAALKMMKGKNVWPTKSESPPSLHLAPPLCGKLVVDVVPFPCFGVTKVDGEVLDALSQS